MPLKQLDGQEDWGSKFTYLYNKLTATVNNLSAGTPEGTSPATLFGGTWSAIAAGRVLVGLNSGDSDFNTAEETGGAKTHTLTDAQMPSHSHTVNHTHTQAAHRHTPSTGTSYEFLAITAGDNFKVNTTARNAASTGGTWNYAYCDDSANAVVGEYAYTDYETPTIYWNNPTSSVAGSDSAHNNVQPYFVVYMWKRTA